MEGIPPKREQRVSFSACAGRGDTSAIVDCAGDDIYGPVCTSSNDQVCQINDCLPYCNKLLFDIGLQLREQRGGSLSLATIPVNLVPRPVPESYRAIPFLSWLLKTHACIRALELCDDYLTRHSQIVLQELPENSGIKKLTLHFVEGDFSVYTTIAKHLPRLQSLEVLHCSGMYACAETVSAISELLKTSKCLTSLAIQSSFECDQPPRTLIEALAENSTLKWLDLDTYWMTANPPGPLGEYVRSNCFLSSLTVSGYDVDREELLLADSLVGNDTLSTLRVLTVFGGRTSVRFITRMLAGCSSLRKLYVGSVQNAFTMIPEAELARCVDALAHNQTLEELMLPYDLWHANDWIVFFAMLPRNKRLKQFYVEHRYPEDYMTLLPVLEALVLTNQSANVSFGEYIYGMGVNFLHFGVFPSVTLSGDESDNVDALKELHALDNITSLSLDIFGAGELLVAALAKYIRETTVLRRLKLMVANPQDLNRTATSTCWGSLLEAMSTNTSISDLDIVTNDNFRYNDFLIRTIVCSMYISRVSFMEDTGLESVTKIVSLLSETIVENYALLEVDLHGETVNVDSKWCLFAIRETTRRNCGLVERAATFNQSAPLDRYTASAFEKVARSPALVRELAQKTGVADTEVTGALRSRLRSVEGLHDFMRLTGVVKECVTCAPPVRGCGTQLHDLNDDCWRLVKSYLSFDDVKRIAVASPFHVSLDIKH